MSLSIIVPTAYQPDGDRVCSVTNLVPAGPRAQDDVESRLFGFPISARCLTANGVPPAHEESHEEVETLGGLITATLGRIPAVGEQMGIGGRTPSCRGARRPPHHHRAAAAAANPHRAEDSDCPRATLKLDRLQLDADRSASARHAKQWTASAD